jgi:hypothetical protein
MPKSLDLEPLKEEAIARAKAADPDIQRASAEVIPEFLDGNLVVVTDDADNTEYFVFFPTDGDPRTLLWGRDLGMYLSLYMRSKSWWNFIMQIGGIAIALLITITICWMSLVSMAEPPEILKSALTVILGFYFGTQVGKSHTQIV